MSTHVRRPRAPARTTEAEPVPVAVPEKLVTERVTVTEVRGGLVDTSIEQA